jgi:UDP-2-acetamido-2-deoxy-ribo-hexuluronate aminotransferase
MAEKAIVTRCSEGLEMVRAAGEASARLIVNMQNRRNSTLHLLRKAVQKGRFGIVKACREIRVHGHSECYRHTRLGVGGRMDTIQRELVLAKWERFKWQIEQRKRLGARYVELIKASGAPVDLLQVADDSDCVWAQYTIKVAAREAVQAALKTASILTAVHSFPESLFAASRVMSLPKNSDMTSEQQQVVATLVVAAART